MLTRDYIFALQQEIFRISFIFVKASLVLQDYVRKPNRVVWDPDNFNAMIIPLVPSKAIIRPLLLMTFERKATDDFKIQA